MILINDDDLCECGAYWCSNGYCCRGHPRRRNTTQTQHSTKDKRLHITSHNCYSEVTPKFPRSLAGQEKLTMNDKSEKLRMILHNLDWIKILDTAIKHRPSSWNFGNYDHPVIEWRNASDGICMAVINALVDKHILEDMYSKVQRFESKLRKNSE